MSIRKLLAAATMVFGAMLLVAPAQAQTMTCDDIVFTGPVLSQFPNAKLFCTEVVQKDGKNYAHFNAEYVRHSGQDVTLRAKMPDGTYGDTVTVRAPEGQRIKINGRELRIRDLNRGDALDIYIPEDRWVAVFQDTPEEFVEAATVEEYDIAPAAATASSLPSTASPMPLVGLLGALFAALGFGGLSFRRARKA
jgi:hypothetical protein